MYQINNKCPLYKPLVLENKHVLHAVYECLVNLIHVTLNRLLLYPLEVNSDPYLPPSHISSTPPPLPTFSISEVSQ